MQCVTTFLGKLIKKKPVLSTITYFVEQRVVWNGKCNSCFSWQVRLLSVWPFSLNLLNDHNDYYFLLRMVPMACLTEFLITQRRVYSHIPGSGRGRRFPAGHPSGNSRALVDRSHYSTWSLRFATPCDYDECQKADLDSWEHYRVELYFSYSPVTHPKWSFTKSKYIFDFTGRGHRLYRPELR